LFNDLACRFGISKGLASKMYNSWMPVLAEKIQGLVVWLPHETIRVVIPVRLDPFSPIDITLKQQFCLVEGIFDKGQVVNLSNF